MTTKTITAKSITESEIKTLRTEAGQSGDYLMAAIADLAVTGSFDRDDWSALESDEARKVSAMTQAEAVEACAEAINDRGGVA